MTQEHKQAQILNSTYQLAETLGQCDDIEVLSYQLRVYATLNIAKIASGELPVTPQLIKSFHTTNELLKEWGKPLLSLDFLD